MTSRIHRIILALAICIGTLAATALDLPIKTIGGRQYYYYKVEGRESVHGLSKKLGLSREQIVSYNPSVADGVRRGTILYFPVDDFAEVESPVQTNDEIATIEPTSIDTLQTDSLRIATQLPDSTIGTPTIPILTEIPNKEPRVLLALPFNLNESSDRRSRQMLDFYKGFLIAADSLCNLYGNVQIKTIDYTSSTTISDEAISEATVLISAETDEQLDSLGRRCAAVGTYLLNIFDARDTSYVYNPYVIQTNTPSEVMYHKAVIGLTEEYTDHIPVILRNTNGQNEKQAFTDYLEEWCNDNNREVVHIDYTGRLSSSDLDVLTTNDSTKYVLIPSSGTLSEFNRFAHTANNFRNSRAISKTDHRTGEVTITHRIAIFGYPDWVAFRSEAENLLHEMEASIYSRYFNNFSSERTHDLESAFIRWYGAPMLESVPTQGLLGYDAGCYVINGIRIGAFQNGTTPNLSGVQSNFNLTRETNGGFVNTSLYIIKFLPTGQMSVRVL